MPSRSVTRGLHRTHHQSKVSVAVDAIISVDGVMESDMEHVWKTVSRGNRIDPVATASRVAAMNNWATTGDLDAWRAAHDATPPTTTAEIV